MTINNSAENIQLEPNTIWRDVGFYILSTFVVIGFGFQGELSVYSAISLLLIYVVMVIVVWFQEKDKEVSMFRN
jgi:sodium/potassium/calcium exchanger 6